MLAQLHLHEVGKLWPYIPLECWQEIRDQPNQKLIKKEHSYCRIMKKIKPKEYELVSHEVFSIDFNKEYETRIIIPHSVERKVIFYYSPSLRQAKISEMKIRKDQEKSLINELKTEKMKNIQILLDKNGKVIQIDNDDIDDDNESVDREAILLEKKRKVDVSNKIRNQNKTSVRVKTS
jgi:hypothetical protein